MNKFEFKCPPGTIFDESIATCNHIYAVEKASPECVAQAEATLDEIRQRVDTTNEQSLQQGQQYQYNTRPGSVIVGKSPSPGQTQGLFYKPGQVVYKQPAAYQLQYLG